MANIEKANAAGRMDHRRALAASARETFNNMEIRSRAALSYGLKQADNQARLVTQSGRSTDIED